jgi:molecular chaperone DnaK
VLSALVLKKLLGDAEQRVGPITEAVVTVPAYFDDTRRKATQDAGEIAGLETTHILNEPTAAALWYGFSEQQAGANKDSTVLIYDLGGGTFDATLMEIRSDGQLLTLGTEGDVMLGGKDWDARLLDYVSSEFMRAEGSDPREDDISYQELVVRVEEGKHTLSKRSTVIIPVTHGGRRARITISREQFKALTGDLLARTQNTLEILMADAGVTWDNLDKVLVVGGASRMVMVREMLAELTGMEPDTGLDADLAVASGAALQAAKLRKDAAEENRTASAMQQIEHQNVNSHSLGVEAWNEELGAMANLILIAKNSGLPCERVEQFATDRRVEGDSADLHFRILEGESPDPDACVPIGECRIEDLPQGLEQGSLVEITFSYSEDGRIHVSAVVPQVGLTATASIVRPHALNHEAIRQQADGVANLQIV